MSRTCCVLDDKWSNEEQQLAQSLPIPIGPLGQHRQSFGIPSYQPKTSLSDRPGVLVPPLRNGSAATSLRRASVRALDPGALDFVVDEDGVDDDVESDPETGGKARERALRILKARDELPAAGECPLLPVSPRRRNGHAHAVLRYRYVEESGLTHERCCLRTELQSAHHRPCRRHRPRDTLVLS